MSEETPKVTIQQVIATLDIDGRKVPVALNPKTFSTGSKGFYYSGKVNISEGERYQTSVMMVLVGSKPK